MRTVSPKAPRRRIRQSGIALVGALAIAAVVGVLVLGSIMLSILDLRITTNDARVAQAVNVAQGGAAYWKSELVSLYRFMIENFELYEDDLDAYIADGGNPAIACGNYLALGIDLDRDGNIDISPGSALDPVSVPVGSATGTSAVTFGTDGANVVLDARGVYRGARARIIERFSVGSVNVWNNAVFAENNAANATIQGRAEIRGAVHILGVGLTSSDMALDVSGSFALGNTYRDLNSSLDVGPEDLALTIPDPNDLCAVLRVKRGYTLMDGSSQIGFAEDAHPDPVQDAMRGIYTNDGIRGGEEGTNVHSLNGLGAAYDSGDSFSFPSLDDEIPPADGTTPTYAEALRDNALVLSTDVTNDGTGDTRWDDRANLLYFSGGQFSDVDGNPITDSALLPQQGGTYLSPGCRAPMFGVVAGVPTTEFVLDQSLTDDFSCIKYRVTGAIPNPATDEVITEVVWNSDDSGATLDQTTSTDPAGTRLTQFSPGELYVGGTGGVVLFEGADLTIQGGGGSNDKITYRGNGILFAETSEEVSGQGGSIDLRVDFIPTFTNGLYYELASDGDAGRLEVTTRTNTYPQTAMMSLVARAQVRSGDAQRRFATTIFAEQSVSVEKQTLVAGSIVTRTFDAGSNVPTVLYVPNVAERLSKLIPGTGGNTFAVSNFAWVRR